MRNPIIYSLLALLFFACTSDADLGQLPNEQKLSLYGLISPDSLICIRLSATVPITQTTFPEIENARIQLYENDVLIGALAYRSEREYVINYFPKAGKSYTIIAEVDGFPSIKSVETLPANIEKIEIGRVSYQYPTGMLEDYIVGTAEFDLIDDSKETVNYYEILFPTSTFSIYSDAFSYDSSKDFMYKKSFLFTNRSFAGKSLHFSIQAGYNYWPVPCARITIRKVSPAYYAYKTTWYEHQNNQMGFGNDFLRDLFFMNSPVNMYSNIENGFGIFASYAETVKESER